MQRQHRTLRKANKRKMRIREAPFGEHFVEKCVEQRRTVLRLSIILAGLLSAMLRNLRSRRNSKVPAHDYR
jgi:hypothetical protein